MPAYEYGTNTNTRTVVTGYSFTAAYTATCYGHLTVWVV